MLGSFVAVLNTFKQMQTYMFDNMQEQQNGNLKHSKICKSSNIKIKEILEDPLLCQNGGFSPC